LLRRPRCTSASCIPGRESKAGTQARACAWAAPLSALGSGEDDALWLTRDGPDGQKQALARFEIEHGLRADASEAVSRLQALGLRVQVASGDASDAVAQACKTLGIEDWGSRLLPPDKLGLLRALQAGDHRVLAVGDGLNDAPLLAGADVRRGDRQRLGAGAAAMPTCC
jgi:Cu2+-exporting ATPase